MTAPCSPRNASYPKTRCSVRSASVSAPPPVLPSVSVPLPVTVPVTSMVTPNALSPGVRARPVRRRSPVVPAARPALSVLAPSPTTIGGSYDNAGRSVDIDRPALCDKGSRYRTKTPAWPARSRKYCGARPSTSVTATPTAIVVIVSGDGTATVGPSAFGSLKNIRTITRM